jgi:hypothetical protein
LNAFALTTADGVEIAADGKIGLTCVTVEPAIKTLSADHAFHGGTPALYVSREKGVLQRNHLLRCDPSGLPHFPDYDTEPVMMYANG